MEPFDPRAAFEIVCGLLWLGLLVTTLLLAGFAARRFSTRKLHQALRFTQFGLWSGLAGLLVGLFATAATMRSNQTAYELTSDCAFILFSGAATTLAYFVRRVTLRKMALEASSIAGSGAQAETGNVQGSSVVTTTRPQQRCSRQSEDSAGRFYFWWLPGAWGMLFAH